MKVNNEIYQSLGDRWYVANDDPIALLRAENVFRRGYVLDLLSRHFGSSHRPVLDLGCGGGLLSNFLAAQGKCVVGVDVSEDALSVAKKYSSTKTVDYVLSEARDLPFGDGHFDAVCVMDLLEHVDKPQEVLAEASRVLASNGLLIFYTFNRTFLSWLVVIKLVELFVKNTPPSLHVYDYFIRPEELRVFLKEVGLEVAEMRGVGPKIFQKAMLKILTTGQVPDDFEFEFKSSVSVGYIGYARKN